VGAVQTTATDGMKINTYTIAVAALFAGVVTACDNKSGKATDQPAAQPMTKFGIDIGLAENYGFMSAMLVNGDGVNYARFYSDTATLIRVGFPPVHGRDSLVEFARRGVEWGIRDVVRNSMGHSFSDNIITDSGRFVVQSDAPLPVTTFPQQGRYWTRWQVRGNRDWVILSDSLQGERPAPSRRAAK
jgi:hypothetical protein